jgi:tetratricopeptide (TPR) repeat protein
MQADVRLAKFSMLPHPLKIKKHIIIFVFLAPRLTINPLMKQNKTMKTSRILLLIAFIGTSLATSAQTINEAGEAFNKGIQFAKEANYTEALTAYQQTIDICNKLGEEGVELQLKAEQQMPSTYFNIAKGLYEAKNYAEAIPNFESAASWADKNGETKTADASRTYLAGIYTSLGNTDFKADAFDKAIENFNKSLTYKADYFKAYYGLGLVYKKQGKLDEMKQAMDKVIELAPAGDKTAENARTTTATSFLNDGATALQKNGFDKAIASLNTSLLYNANEPKAYYYLALAYNGKKSADEAITAANKAIELGIENVGDAWFEIGKANEIKADAAAACTAYKNVTSGPNVQAAKYQMEQVLKCK